MSPHEKLHYVEFGTRDIKATKQFFSKVFNWSFTDYGEDYTDFSNQQAGLSGGFFSSNKTASTKEGSALLVFYSEKLEDTQLKIIKHGGKIAQEIFSFPGGRRFHFIEPGGNELAVWSNQT